MQPPNGQFQRYAPPPVYQQPVAPAPRKNVRFWAVLFVIAAFVAAGITPEVGVAISGLLVALIIIYLTPRGAIVARGPLGVVPGRPIRTTFKLIFVAVLAIALFADAIASKQTIENGKREAEQTANRLAEQQELTREANASVDILMVDVRRQFQARNVAAAVNGLKIVLATPNATNKVEAQHLSDAVALSTDAARVKTLLVEMSDEDFKAFATNQRVPAVFDGVYPVVTEAIVALAKPLAVTIGPQRDELARIFHQIF
jgi:hypothetical protein